MKSLAVRTFALFALISLTVLPAACQTATPAKAPAPAPAVSRQASDDEPPIRVLELSNEYVFDAAGNYTRTKVHRYRVLTADGLDEASDFEAEWQPWYMARPEVSVRVVDPRGGVHPVEAASLVESNVDQSSPGVLSDKRVLRAPLPGLEVGSTVEERVVWRTTKPYSPAGIVHSYFFGGPVPVDATRLVIDAPESLPLRHRVLDAKVSFKEEKTNGRRRLTFAGGPYDALESLEPLQVPEVAPWPEVAFSTGKSWQDVARVYDATVNRALEGADLTATAQSVVSSADLPRTKAQKLLAWARSHVRYADVELGDASYEPAKPSETLRRGYGDCKDQAVLLTGLLRASGLDAHVVLVRTGPGEDVREDLPGFGSFDHAIVMVAGKEPIYMDPTASYYPAGVLPSGEQGRLALIVAPATEALSRMPELPASANAYIEEREIYFSDFEGGRVVETTTAAGIQEAILRASYSGSRDSIQSQLDGYTTQEYGASAGTKVDFGAVTELEKPLRVRLEVPKASRVVTDLDQAAVMFLTSTLLSPLPRSLLSTETRRTPARLPSAFRSEVRYHVVPPKGFVLAEQPKFEPIDVGPAKLSRTVAQNRDGSLSAVFRFEIAKTRLEAKEVEALRVGVRSLDEQASTLVRFMHEGAKLVAEGKLREGMDVYRRSLGTPMGRIRFASALLDAGLVEDARREARKAVELGPNMAVTHRQLGFILLHDTVGRQLVAGFDREGAMAEFRKAMELDPKDVTARVNLAIALERDANGVKSRNAADLRRALELYDAIDPVQITDISGVDYSNNVIEVLFQLGRFDEALQRLGKRPPERAAHNYRAVAVAATRGAPAAIDEVVRVALNDESRAQVLASAAAYLYMLRRYPEAAALYEAAARTGKEAATYRESARQLRLARKYETLTFSDKNPEDFVKLAMLRVVLGTGSGPLYAEASDLSAAEAERQIWSLRREFIRQLKGVPADSVVDVLIASWKLTRETKGPIEIVHAEMGTGKMTFTLVREGGVYRLLSVSDDVAYGVCAGALHAVKELKDAEAKPWLDLGKKMATSVSAADELDAPLMQRAWGRGGDIRAATGCLCIGHADARRLVNLLVESRDRVKDPEQQRAVDQALTLAALRAEDGARALEASGRLLAVFPKSTTALHLRFDVLSLTNRHDELRAALKKALASAPGDPYLLALKAQLEDRTGHFDEAGKTWRKLLDAGRASELVYNNAAWSGLFQGKPTEQADIDVVLQGTKTPWGNTVNALHTLAMLYADAGRANEARQTLQLVVDKQESHVLEPKDYLVLGRIAELYGLEDLARDAYDRVTKSPGGSLSTSWDLAQKRRAGLGKALERK
ncbi:DUF3857 domain-containing protein [Pendulispora brunnea]|uniref:DUF3857 domain-containing protein n=1 Tax=Pendulispora brunnea TaxID=2905690 RepID=A0ABZ2K9A2_9BACT